MSHLRHHLSSNGFVAVDARVAHPVAGRAMRTPHLLRRIDNNWSVNAAADLTCGFPTAMKVYERRPQEGSS
jgi:hypothetical protein